MEDEDPDASPRYDFDWFAPWQWDYIVMLRVGCATVVSIIAVWFVVGFIIKLIA